MEIRYTSKFLRAYKKLPLVIQVLAEERELVFRENPYDPKLRTHQLKGKLKGFWSFSIGFRYRIIFEFLENNTVVLYQMIGNHSIYQ